MAQNFPGPYEVDYSILVTGITHHLRLSCVALGSPLPGTAPALVNLQTRAGTPQTLQICAQSLWNFLRIPFHNSVTLTGFTLWRYPIAGSLQKDFVTSGVVTNPAGASTSATTLAHQQTLSFRSANGGVMKVVMLESAYSGNARNTLISNGSGSSEQQIAAYLLSSAGWAIARDDSFPIVPLFSVGGQNEAIYKIRFR